MAKVRYLTSTRTPGLKFRVLSTVPLEDGAGVRAVLEGSHGVTFEKVITDELLQKNGYTVEVVVEDDSPPVR